jgi:c-di-GMP-binding flagellar brake protein YcgR
MNNEEKRKHFRIDSLNLLNYIYLDEKKEASAQGMGRTLNVSESGILLETHNAIDIGLIVSLTIGLEENMVDIKGRAIYANKNDQEMFETGIEFFDVDANAQNVLHQYIVAFNKEHRDR